MHTSGRICSVEVAGEGRGTGVGNGGEHFGSDMGRNDFSRNPIRGMNMQQQTAHLAGDQRVKFFTGRLWSHLFGRTSGRRRPTAGHRAGRADGAPAVRTPLAFLVLGLFVAADALAAGTATVTLRPTHVDISSTTSRQAVLMTLSGYTAGSLPRYRIYNGSYQYAPWNADTGAFVTSTSYSAGPLVPGDYVSGTTFWILCQRNNNASVTATYPNP